MNHCVLIVFLFRLTPAIFCIGGSYSGPSLGALTYLEGSSDRGKQRVGTSSEYNIG